jgi:hypothetical protein
MMAGTVYSRAEMLALKPAGLYAGIVEEAVTANACVCTTRAALHSLCVSAVARPSPWTVLHALVLALATFDWCPAPHAIVVLYALGQFCVLG